MKLNKIMPFILYLVLLAASPNAGVCQAIESKKSIEMTDKRITIAVSTDTVPFHFIDDQGQPAGIVVDMWKLWSKKTGFEIAFKSAPWNETIAMVQDGRADAHAGLNYNPDRDRFLDFGDPLARSDSFFFFHKNIYGLNSVKFLVLRNWMVKKSAPCVTVSRLSIWV